MTGARIVTFEHVAADGSKNGVRIAESRNIVEDRGPECFRIDDGNGGQIEVSKGVMRGIVGCYNASIAAGVFAE